MNALRLAAVLLFAVATEHANAAPCAGFTDVEDTSPFCPSVSWMKSRGITLGCAPGLYCPNDPVSRLAMAAFMSRMDSLNPTFVDAAGRRLGSVPYWSASGFTASGATILWKSPVGHVALYIRPQASNSPGLFRLGTGGWPFFLTPDCTGQSYVRSGTIPVAPPSTWTDGSVPPFTHFILAGPGQSVWIYSRADVVVPLTFPSPGSTFSPTTGACVSATWAYNPPQLPGNVIAASTAFIEVQPVIDVSPLITEPITIQ